jgi:hypothetical protein
VHLNTGAAEMHAASKQVCRGRPPVSPAARRAFGLPWRDPQQAFDDVFQAMDEIDRYKTEATWSMKQTVTVLEGQVCRARLQLERIRCSSAATAELERSEPCPG